MRARWEGYDLSLCFKALFFLAQTFNTINFRMFTIFFTFWIKCNLLVLLISTHDRHWECTFLIETRYLSTTQFSHETCSINNRSIDRVDIKNSFNSAICSHLVVLCFQFQRTTLIDTWKLQFFVPFICTKSHNLSPQKTQNISLIWIVKMFL